MTHRFYSTRYRATAAAMAIAKREGLELVVVHAESCRRKRLRDDCPCKPTRIQISPEGTPDAD